MQNRKWLLALVPAVMLFTAGFVARPAAGDDYFEISKNLDIFAFFRDGISEGKNGSIISSFFPAIVEYFKPGFHPSDHDDYAMAKAVVDRIEKRMENVA